MYQIALSLMHALSAGPLAWQTPDLSIHTPKVPVGCPRRALRMRTPSLPAGEHMVEQSHNS